MNTHVLNLRNSSAPDMCAITDVYSLKKPMEKSLYIDKNVQQKLKEISQDYFYPSQ